MSTKKAIGISFVAIFILVITQSYCTSQLQVYLL